MSFRQDLSKQFKAQGYVILITQSLILEQHAKNF